MRLDRAISRIVVAGLSLLMIACASDTDKPDTSLARLPLSERLNAGSAMAYAQNEDGSWMPRNTSQRSSFELNRESSHFKGNYAGKEYPLADRVQKRAWWGSKEISKSAYAGRTEASQFKTPSVWQGKSNDAGSQDATLAEGHYATNGYETSSAREGGGTRLSRPSDAETNYRRRVFREPGIIDWRQQRDFSVGDTKRLLGSD